MLQGLITNGKKFDDDSNAFAQSKIISIIEAGKPRYRKACEKP